MSTVQYPAEFPIDNIRGIVDGVRNGNISENLDKFGYDVWVVQGFAQKALLGDPNADGGGDGGDGPGFVLMSAADVDDEAALQALESLASDAPQAQVDIPWDLILSFLFKLLEEWLSNRG